MHSLLARMLGSKAHHVEDLAQETFFRALRSLSSFRVTDEARCSTWLLTIATRLALNQLARRQLVLQEGEIESPGSDQGPETALREKRVSEAFVNCVERLSLEQRAVFVLFSYEERSYTEIAAMLGIEVGTVRSRLSRARETLAAELRGLGYL